MRRFALAILLVLAPVLSAQQQQANLPVPVTLESKILGETRQILVRTPASYRTGTRPYPVLYMTDGDRQIEHTAAVADFLVREGRIPELIIVGISNTDRTRDLTPTHVAEPNFDGRGFRAPTSGGGDRFLDFIEREVIPLVEKSYRTQPYRVFAGHSFGGLFAMHAAFTRPHLFNSVIAVSPTLVWDNRYVYRKATEWAKANRTSNATLVFSVGNEGDALDREFDSLQQLLKTSAPKGFEWKAIRYEDEDHGSVVLPTHYAGLRKAFEPFRFTITPQDDPKKLYARASEHFEKASARAGFRVLIPEATTNLIGYRLLQGDHTNEAIEVFRKNVEAYPQSANVYDSLAEAYEKAGDLKRAKENYARAAAIGKSVADPNTRIYEENLARVTKALAEKEVSRLGGTVETESGVIVKIDLHETQVTDDDLEFLHGLTSLRYLDLRRTGVGDAAADHLRDLHSLETVNLFRTRLGDAGLRTVGSLRSLRTLFLGGTEITDDGLAALSNLTQLRKLSVFDTAISDAGLVHLQSLPQLEVLLIGRSKITEDVARAALPRVRFTEQT